VNPLPKTLERVPDFWAVFDAFGVDRSLCLVKGVLHVEFQVPRLPEELVRYVANWKVMGLRVDFKVKDWWPSDTPAQHLFFYTVR